MNGRWLAIWMAIISVTASGYSGSCKAEGAPTLDKARVLALHNKYRAEVGVPPLRWSEKLASGAEKWAKVIAGLNKLQHSDAAGVGENLAFWSGSNSTVARMMATWAIEKGLFSRGVFPQISRTGNWLSVSHYSQMIWRATTEVGCGIGNNGQSDFLVCWYNPKGNWVGQAPY